VRWWRAAAAAVVIAIIVLAAMSLMGFYDDGRGGGRQRGAAATAERERLMDDDEDEQQLEGISESDLPELSGDDADLEEYDGSGATATPFDLLPDIMEEVAADCRNLTNSTGKLAVHVVNRGSAVIGNAISGVASLGTSGSNSGISSSGRSDRSSSSFGGIGPNRTSTFQFRSTPETAEVTQPQLANNE